MTSPESPQSPSGLTAVTTRLGVGRQALSDGASSLGLEIGQLIGTFVFFALIGRGLGPTDYGSFAAMYSLIGVSLALAYIGPGLAFLQTAMGSSAQSVSAHFFSIYLGFVCVSIAVVVALSPFILPALSTWTVLLFLVAELLGATLVQIARTLRLIVVGFRATVMLQLSLVLVKTVTVVALYVTDSLTLLSYGIVYSTCCVVLGVVVFFRVTTALQVPRQLGKLRREHVSATVTLSTALLVFNVHNDGDKLVMSANGLGADVGLYAAAYRMVLLAVIPINALVASSHRTFVDPTVENQMRRAVKYTLASTVYCTLAAAALIVAAPVILPLIVGDGFSGAITITRWLAPLMIVRGFTHFPLNALMGLGHSRPRLWCIVLSATVAMVLYLLLVPSMSWKGAVIGSYCSDAVLAISGWIALWRVRDQATLVARP
ncbi:MAG: lipopolysaccharide biosynthesis protein [Ilumatobacteraceae bacterium]